MSQRLWNEVDDYVGELLLGADPVLEDALAASAAGGLPGISVSAPQGKLLQLLAQIHGARRILEVGTLGGYSTIWLARALPADGHLTTLELNPRYAAVAAANVERAGFAGLIDIRVGPALASLEALIEERPPPFDMTFIDADKQSTPEYFLAALELSRPGGLVVVDNSVRDGALIDARTREPGARGMRRFHELLADERRGAGRVSATTIQTVGEKGYDGFTVVRIAGAETASCGDGHG
jgi:predicted O-methyltransferase YrrM